MNLKYLFPTTAIICLGSILAALFIFDQSIGPTLVETKSESDLTDGLPASTLENDSANEISLSPSEDPVKPVESVTKKQTPPDGAKTIRAKEVIAKTTQTNVSRESLRDRLKQLSGTEVLDFSVEEKMYGEAFSRKRSYLLKTPLKYPYLVVVEWGRFDQNGTSGEIESETAQVADHLIVKARENISLPLFFKQLKSLGLMVGEAIDERTYLVKIPGEVSLEKYNEAIASLSSLTEVTETSEPDFLVSTGKVPTDDRYFDLWGLNNTGQTGGRNDVDIDAPEAWDRGTGSKKVLVAVIDTGIDRKHNDLKANIWTNPNEIPNNGKDDDGNGYVDDVHGWDFHNNDNDPHDDNSHGTHCAGTIGASGNNRLGVVGVNWEVSLVGIKFLGRNGSGYISDAVKATHYATTINAKLTSNSWGGGGYSSSMKTAIENAGEAGIAFIAAAGNHRADNDRSPSYPASYDCTNIIAVGANDHKGNKASFSCYGKNSVDLFAPGVGILSTTPGNQYKSYQGTSMATPHVSGAYALIAAIEPTWGMKQIKDAILARVDPEEGLKEKCVSGGRLNVFNALSSEPKKEKLIAAIPVKIDFGSLRSGVSGKVELEIKNPGQEKTTISKASIDSSVTRARDLIGHWTFDEGSGSTAVNTGTKGSAYDAILVDGAVFSKTEKKFGDASLHLGKSFGKARGKVKSPLPLGPTYRETFSISAWFKKLYPRGKWRTLSRGSSYGHHLIVYYMTDDVGVYANGNGSWRNSGEFDMASADFQNDWHNVAVVSDKNTNKTRFYLNGNYKGDSDRPTGNNVYAIGNHTGGDQRFAEFIDDFRVYGVALSSKEIASVYEEKPGADSPFQFSLKAPIILAPGASIKTPINFIGGSEGKYQANMVITSDAKNKPLLQIPLLAQVSAFPKLVVSPASIHFALKPDEVQEKMVMLSNQGDAVVEYEITIAKERSEGKQFKSFAKQLALNPTSEEMFSHPHVPGRLIIGFRPGQSVFRNSEPTVELNLQVMKSLNRAGRKKGLRSASPPPEILLFSCNEQISLAQARKTLLEDPNVEYVEPDYLMASNGLPNDPHFAKLWGLRNVGQEGGLTGADVDAPRAWSVHRGSPFSKVVVGVIDSGVDFSHPDMQGTAWKNEGEIPGNGIDDDENGYVDDVHGYDFANDKGNVVDDHGHGTHNASTMAATMGNGIGVTGLASNLKVASLKFLKSNGGGSLSDAVEAINYATAMEISLTCNSWGGAGYSRSLQDAIEAAGDKGFIFVASAGNQSKNLDRTPRYPASYSCENIIAVASTDRRDNLAAYSNWGAKTIDLAAPGMTYAAIPGGQYAWNKGTSNCVPQVAGGLALLKSFQPELSGPEMKSILMESVEKLTALKGKTKSEGRINLHSILQAGSSPWLTVDQISGVIDPGKSIQLKAVASATHISGTKAEGAIVIRSNDPDAPEKTIKATAEILTDGKHLTFEPYQISFEETYVGQTAEKTLTITNGGTKKVSISRFVFRSPSFSHRISLPISLKPGEQRVESIFFSPSQDGALHSEALILTDEDGEKARTLAVSGTGVAPPRIRVEPMTLNASLGFNEELTQYVEIFNDGSGSGPLRFTIKGATPPGGLSNAVPLVFGAQHFQPLSKGAIDSREGSPIAPMGGGPDHGGYSWSDSSDPAGPEHQWTDRSEKGLLLSKLSDMDDGYAKIALPFAMEFYGKRYSEVYVNTNGYLTFEKGSLEHGHYPLPSPMMPEALVAAFAMDLNPSRGGDIYHYADSKEVVIQYDRVKDFAGQGDYTFQISLGRDGVIRFHYHEMNGVLNGAVAGIQNDSADVGLLVAYNNEQTKGNSSVRISTSPKWLHASNTEGVVATGKSARIPITFKAGSIDTGKYLAVLKVTSNDPQKPFVDIPVTFQVKATRTLVAEPSAIDFGEVEVGLTKKNHLVLRNAGNAPISLSSLKINSEVISVRDFTQEISAGKEINVEIEFRPSQGTSYSANCEIRSNADNPLVEVRISGKGLATPIAKVEPASIKDTIPIGQKMVKRVILSNDGLADLTWSLRKIQSGSQKKSSLPQEDQNFANDRGDQADPFAADHLPGRLIVAFKQGQSSFADLGQLSSGIVLERRLAQARQPGAAGAALSTLSLALVRSEGNNNLREVAAKLALDPAVAWVEPDYVVKAVDTPNDPDWGQQWALKNVQATEAWKITTGSPSINVAVIDTGIDYNHPDLKGNLWKNPGEIAGNGKDDDGNGFVDDVYGWDFSNNDNDPMDGHYHGTHVAGTIAAATNNGKQVAGVAWQAKLAAIKFLSDAGSGSTSGAIDSIAYSTAMGFSISNNSWGGGGYSKSLKAAISAAGEAGQLFCAAAGNSGSNNDSRPHYPSSYDCPNVIAVAATDSRDRLAYFSCYGPKSVDLAAPGVSILSLAPNGKTTRLSGTSMATPHVAGAAVLLLSQNPLANPSELKKILMDSIDPLDSLKGKMVAGGRLNLAKAVKGFAPSWLSVSPKAGIVKPGEFVELSFAIDATHLAAGIKTGIVTMATNDPLAENIEVPVEMTVSGEPLIELEKRKVAFGETWVGTEKTLILPIANSGTDELIVTKVSFGHGDFSASPKEMKLKPGEKGSFEVVVNPSASGSFATHLVISSNAENEPEAKVSITMEAKLPPAIQVQPESVSMSLEPGKKGEFEISTNNLGEGTLEWLLTIVSDSGGKSKKQAVDQVIQSLNKPGRAPENSTPGMPNIGKEGLAFDDKQLIAARLDGGNDASKLEVAVLGADVSKWLEDVGKGLAETKRFSGVTMINMQRLTPTPAELEAFDSLIVYSNYRYRNHEKLGNLLADYVDAGMGVVTMPFENSTWLSKTCSMGGRWQTEGYSVFTTSGADCKRDASALGRIDLAGHPLTREFASLKGSYRLKVNPKTESTLVASWQDDLPLAAFNMSKGLIVGLNFYPGSNRVVSKSWDHKTDGWKLMANALEWTAANGSSHWLTANPMTASVIGGKNKSITLSFDAEKLTEGDYAAELRFQSNDPKNPYVTTKVSLEVRENQAPVAKPISLSLLEDNSKQFELLGEDPEKEPITFTILKQPKHGSLRGKAPDLTYEPNPEFNGNDEFVYRVSDGRKNSDSAIVSIFVQSVNDRPWAKPLEIATTEDTPVGIAFAYGDVDGDQLKLIFSRDPEGGFLWEDEGAWSYFPNPHFNGKDSFTFKVSDGISESSETEVSIVISATNDAPIAKNMEIKVNEDQSVTFDLDAVDVDGDKIQFELVSLPRHGELTQEGNRCVYLPYSDYNGKDSFRFCAADSKVRGNEAVVELTVTQKNDRPIIQPAHFKGMEDGKVQIKLIASDPDGDALTFRTITGPSSGTLEGNGTMYEYTPKKDFYGDDSFVVVANDGMLDSDPAKITVEVSGSNDAPQFAVMAENNSKASYRETPVCLPLKASDPDGDTLEFKIVSATANGECFVSGNEFIYYPSRGFTGNDEVVLGVSDGKLSDTIRLQLSIREHPNAIPIHLEGKDETELGGAFLHLMYELNGRLLEKGNPLFKLQATDSTLSSLNNERSKDDKLIGVRLSSEDASEDGTPPFEWIESMPDFEGAKFLSFNRLKNDLGEHWSVSPLFLPPFSTDKGVDDESSSSDQDMDESNKESKRPSGMAEELGTLGQLVELGAVEQSSRNNESQGWYKIGSLGDFYDAGNGWIYQPDLGWCYAVANQETSCWWLFNESTGWIWFNPEIENSVWSSGRLADGWIYFPGDTLAQKKVFYNYSAKKWQKWNK